MESQPQNLEFRNNPENCDNFYVCFVCFRLEEHYSHQSSILETVRKCSRRRFPRQTQ